MSAESNDFAKKSIAAKIKESRTICQNEEVEYIILYYI